MLAIIVLICEVFGFTSPCEVYFVFGHAKSSAPWVQILHLWHLMSLDAPTVATVWMSFVAHCFGVTIPTMLLVAVFVGSWIFYSLDRLLEHDELRRRHRFHQRHKKIFATVIMLGSPVVIFSFFSLESNLIVPYLMLSAFLGVYFAAIHFWKNALALKKPLLVGIFFAATVFLPLAQPELAFFCAFLLFGSLCSLNCLFIDLWENASSIAVARFAVLLLILCCVCLIVHMDRHWILFAPMTLSATLLLILHATRHEFDATTLRSCADLALLTPLLFWLHL